MSHSKQYLFKSFRFALAFDSIFFLVFCSTIILLLDLLRSVFQMIPDEKTSSVGRQEFIDLLCRITKTSDEAAAETNAPDVPGIAETPAAEEGEIIPLDDDEASSKKEVEDGEITESQSSDVRTESPRSPIDLS